MTVKIQLNDIPEIKPHTQVPLSRNSNHQFHPSPVSRLEHEPASAYPSTYIKLVSRVPQS